MGHHQSGNLRRLRVDFEFRAFPGSQALSRSPLGFCSVRSPAPAAPFSRVLAAERMGLPGVGVVMAVCRPLYPLFDLVEDPVESLEGGLPFLFPVVGDTGHVVGVGTAAVEKASGERVAGHGVQPGGEPGAFEDSVSGRCGGLIPSSFVLL